jgi:hypothetical protein
VHFVRTKYCGKALSATDANSATSQKQIKEFFITTGIVLAYQGSFESYLYSIQTPSKERVPADYSIEYYNKLILHKRLSAKKKVEKNLATLVKTVR